MRFIKIYLGAILMFLSIQAGAQGFVENALLFSRTRPGGSARIQAMGGAQVALGGDYSSALSNPAGLGMYNRSEFTFTPALNFYSSDSHTIDHGGNSQQNDSKSVFNIPGLSYVHHSPRDNNGFMGGSFAITMSRINDFNNTFRYGGTDNTSSIIDYFEQMAQGYSIDPLPSPYNDTPLLNYDAPEGLAYLGFLINPFSETSPYPSPFTNEDYLDYTSYSSDLDRLVDTTEVRTLNRNGHVNVRGAQYQWSLAYGGNYKDKLFFGASVGITSLRYRFSSSYDESNYTFSADPTYNPLNSMDLSEVIEIDGSGVNLTLGLIYRFVDFAQVGVSLVTPTFYALTDAYTARLTADWNPLIRSNQQVSSNPIISDYNIVTPMKFSTGAAFFIGKYGLISGDVEFVNYSRARYNSDTPGVSFSPDNDDIRYYYTNVVNYRLGAEGRIGMFRVRAGYNVQNNAYRSTFNTGSDITTLSGGVGIKLAKFSIDGTWLNTQYNSSYSPYAVVADNGELTGPTAELKNTLNSAMITFGFTF